MNTDERQCPDRQITPNRGRVLAALVAVLLVAGLATQIAVATDHGNWQPAYMVVCYGAMALFPFLLARLAPTAAAFDTQWLPSSRRHWVWFLGMFALLFASKLFVAALAVIIIGTVPPPEPPGTLSAPIGHIFQAIALVLVGPVAEEILFRGYVLEQLRKLVRSSIALFVQSFLFALVHLFSWGFDSFSLLNSLGTLLFGLVAGVWRIKFRSLLPIALGHILCNAIGIPLLVEEYNRAVFQIDAAETAQSEGTVIDELMERANALFSDGEYPLALRELEKVIEVEPRFYPGHYLLAWIYATSPDPACRDKEKALFHAERSANLWLQDSADSKESHWNAWACLAAAHAERGDFDKAIENQKKAIECLPTVPEWVRPRVERGLKAGLLLYTARKPLRSKATSLGRVSDAWLNSMSNPGPKEFPEIAE